MLQLERTIIFFYCSHRPVKRPSSQQVKRIMMVIKSLRHTEFYTVVCDLSSFNDLKTVC